jgi:hypothetical protein
MKTITKSLRPYGHAHSSLIGRYLVEQGIADTRAIKMAQGLEQFMIAIACMDERNKKILLDIPYFSDFYKELERIEGGNSIEE